MLTPTKDVKVAQVLADLVMKFNIDPLVIDAFSSYLKPVKLKKGENFIEVGTVCKQIGILVNGLLYARYLPDNGKDECVSRFFYLQRNFIVTNFQSYHSGRPSNESITALEESYVLTIEKNRLEDLYKNYPLLNIIGRNLAEQSYVQAMDRVHSLQALNVEQRIAECHEQQPELFKLAKRKDLASYLGINRNEISKYLKKYMG